MQELKQLPLAGTEVKRVAIAMPTMHCVREPVWPSGKALGW